MCYNQSGEKLGGEQHQQHDGLRPLRARARRAVAHGGTQERQSSFLDISLRMPRCFLFLEDEARKAIGRRLSRGHVDVFCTYRNQREDARGVQVDEGLIRAYLRATDALTGLADDRSVMGVLSLPEVVQVVEAEEDREALRALLLETLEGALDEAAAMRAVEGEALQRDLNARADALEKIGAIAARAPQTLIAYRERLRANVEELLGGQMDEARLVQEVAIMADRLAIDEELVRLESHIAQLRALLATPPPPGGGWTFSRRSSTAR